MAYKTATNLVFQKIQIHPMSTSLGPSSPAMSTAGPHILVYPFISSGHIIPLLDLTHRLLRRGLSITLVITTNNLPLLNPFLSSYSSSQFQHLPLPHPQIPPNNPTSRLLAMLRFMRQHHYPPLLNFFQSHSSPPVAIISDFFIGWSSELAAQVDVPRLVFSPSGAFAFAVSASTWRELPQNDNPENEDFIVKFPNIPNSPSYPWWQINQLYRKPRDCDWEFFRDSNLTNQSSWGIIINSFSELEGVYLDHVKKELGHDRVWAVGPLLPPDDDLTGPANRGGSSSVPCHDVLTWLDSRKKHSVVYICFGSRTWLTGKQMDQLAGGLEKSEVNFILCDRQPDPDGRDIGVLPEGFEARVGGKGLIIRGWAPQVAVLRHPAVGSFLTHCGWNSVLEGISAGVVMLTWPMGADQYTNAQLLVDQLGVGIRVGENARKIPESAELAGILSESVQENLAQRVKAKKLKEAALSAMNKGGSSDKDLDALVGRLNQLP